MRALPLVLAACSSAPPAQLISNTRPAAPVVVTADCDRLAAVIAPIPGERDCCGGEAGRRKVIGEWCTTHRWGPAAIECVTTAHHDPMSCLTGPQLDPDQSAAWSEKWNEMYLRNAEPEPD